MIIRGVGSASRRELSFRAACAGLETALADSARHQIVDEVSKARSFDRSARHLRDGMRAHRFEAGGQALFSGNWVRHFDNLTRDDGFHALHDWDGKADRFCDDTIPVEVANFVERVARPADQGARRVALAVLLDYYFLHLLGLLSLRAFDEGDANSNLDDIDRMLGHLQGAMGSGQKFARDVETLLLIATSHFEPDVSAYEGLRLNLSKLNPDHRLNLAITHGAILGCHLRFGLEVTCAGSLNALRDDNVPDYPSVSEAILTLIEAYAAAKTAGREGGVGVGDEGKNRIIEALLLALTPDPEAFIGAFPPDSLAHCEGQRRRACELFVEHRAALLRDFEALRPSESAYSPLSFTFNFPHNLVKGVVVDAALRGVPWTLGLDDLLTAFPKTLAIDAARHDLALRLMSYAVASPDTIRGKPHPAIVYDAAGGLRAFERTIKRLGAQL